ncbi:hypothetical protein DHEL01_v204828 [Diaporthe helianthi]|uniref:Uncharacterized protein n=1 Tax=Diaporthe helianthi TaxID=158607 RepID=A0A2P5I2R9_DIAHE|nr:hypothetical protein DHEL01_v204828 [Diaporthe helianthi]
MLNNVLTLAWLLAALDVSCHVSAYDPNTGSSASGDLSTAAPYGLPASKFQSDTNKPDAAAAFNIAGYDVSADSTPQSVDGWKLEVAVKSAVSLSDATNSSINKDQVFEATTLYIQAPNNMEFADSWRMCAVVYPGLVNSVDSFTAVDGSCNGILSTDCVQALTVAAGGSNSNGMDKNGNCTEFVLPARCTEAFPNDSVRIQAIAINQTVLDDKRFYAYGSQPGDLGNSTAAGQEAQQNVWPVVNIFGHLSSSGTRESTNVGVQCVRAINGTTDNVTSGACRVPWAANHKTSVFGILVVLGWLMAA